MTKHNIGKSNSKISSVETFEGESIEQKCRRTTQSNEPIEAISPMIYTERKDGVLPEYDIRCDKWLVAQTAMNTIATKTREERQKRIDKQVGNSKMNAPETQGKNDGTQLA